MFARRFKAAGTVFAALLLACLGPIAADPAHAAEAPAQIPTSAFAKRSLFTGIPQLSPDGKRIAFSLEENKQAWLGVLDIASGEMVRKIPLEEDDQELRWFRWAGNDRLLLSLIVPIESMYWRGQVARLFVADLPSHQSSLVGPSRGQGFVGDNILHIDPAGEFVLLSLQPQPFVEPEVWRFRLDGTDTKGTKVAAQRGIFRWFVDNEGAVRVGLGYENRKVKVWYRKDGTDELKLIARVREPRDDAEDKDEIWDVVRLIKDSDEGLVFEPGDSGRLALRRFNYATRELGEVVYENKEWDLSGVELDDAGKPVAIHYIDDRDRIVWLDPQIARVQRRLESALPGAIVLIADRAKDGSRYLIATGSASDPGAWYVYTTASRELKEFSKVRPEIDPSLLAEVKAVAYKARDGTEIRAYLTLPKGREAKGLPLIILPHGGPYGIRDKLDYSNEVQLLANRGYAVLQPNYRGSGGLGEAFDKLGRGQVGRKMQDDLDDAMDWAVAEGIADRQRVCLVGSSYGGYASLWGAIRNPERYRCAASFAGVTEWDKMLEYDSEFFSRQSERRWRDRIIGEEKDFDLDLVSPAPRAKDLSRPLLLAHGRKDKVVPFTQFRTMRNKLQAAGKRDVVYLELEESGHGFATPEDEQKWYDTLLAFLARHNPPT
jgi:dipeptidyl aminopeptidase/acylaminoacyl peptidase